MPGRAEEAAKMVRMGYASEAWVTRPVSPATELQTLGIRFVGEDEYSREVLIHEGVSQEKIQVLRGVILDTEPEIQEVLLEMRRTRKSSVIIVTSPQHTRRVQALWMKFAPKDRKAIVHAAYEDPFDADHWWRNTRDSLSVMRETLGLLNAWAGLPVRPHSD
jgi:DUF218 domain